MKAIDPSHDRLVMEYREHSSDEVQERIRLVSEGFRIWSQQSFAERAACLQNLAGMLREREESCARLIATEMGKPIKQARAEVQKCASACDYFAENGAEFLKNEQIDTGARKSYISFEPLGVILGIMPWNYPFWQVMRFAVPALMAGNVILLKHASNVSGCALMIEALFAEAGFPANILKVLLIPAQQVAEVIAHKEVKGVALTGSDKAGMEVGALAGKEVKKSVLELGGSDPFIVLDDANIEACVATAVTARLNNCGQSCIAAKRFIIAKKQHDIFCRELLAKLKKIKIGDPLNEETEMGPLAREDLLQTVDRQVQISVQKGAKLLCGGKRLDREGFFYPPTLLTQVKPGMPAYNEETFGPVFAIIAVEDADEAIAVANDCPYGLGASLWTQDLEKGERLARRIDSGNVYINAQTVSNFRLPFGGVKKSGYGRELSHIGIKEFVNIKTIYVG